MLVAGVSVIWSRWSVVDGETIQSASTQGQVKGLTSYPSFANTAGEDQVNCHSYLQARPDLRNYTRELNRE